MTSDPAEVSSAKERASVAPNAIRKGLAGAPIFSENFSAYSDSNSAQGINSAIITHRLSDDNFPEKGISKFSGVSSDWTDLRYICSC